MRWIAIYDDRLAIAAKEDARAKTLMAVPGVGKLTATAVLAAVADAHHFNNGRDFAANLGLVPREHSSGGKQRLFGITKRGARICVHCSFTARAAPYDGRAKSRTSYCAGR